MGENKHFYRVVLNYETKSKGNERTKNETKRNKILQNATKYTKRRNETKFTKVRNAIERNGI